MKSSIKKIAGIGGGASGVLSSILIKKNCDCEVTIFEKQNRILKKLLNTGNGMCNISNTNCDDLDNILKYYNTDLIKDCLKEFNLKKEKEIFNDLGIIFTCDDNGRLYPYSKKASSVLDCFLREIDNLGIDVITDTEIISIDDSFNIKDNHNNSYHFDYVIVSSGGKSAINFEYRMFDILKKSGHKITKLFPSLVGFKVSDNIKSLSGIRFKAKASLLKGNCLIGEKIGEVQFKDDGVSGICVMELSRFYNYGDYYISLDLVNDYSYEELYSLLSRYYKKYKQIEDCLSVLLPKAICLYVAKKCDNLSDACKMINNFKLRIIDTYSYKMSQLMRGGVSLDSVNNLSFESKILSNLYIIGEALDVDGTCGGYNLHFAWASAYQAASSIIKKVGVRV